jgi:putative DNA primase/helicase
MTDFKKLHSSFFGNMTQGLYKLLASDLKVSAEALELLQVGYCPRVQLKGKNGEYTSYNGWFSSPMRDAQGEITGLALRGWDGSKITYPDSKLGYFYVPNPSFKAGQEVYVPGPHNWTRIANAGIRCPICGKPDGCLVSRENPNDPKAVICVRIQSGVQLPFGYLHIRKPEGDVKGTGPIAGTGLLLVTEGMSDVAAAMTLGKDGLGRPNNLAKLDMLPDLVRGRKIVIMGENDKKPDGTWPGRTGAFAALAVCKGVESAVVLMPIPAAKDLRKWLQMGLTAETLDSEISTRAENTPPTGSLSSDDPNHIADQFLRTTFWDDSRTTLRYWSGEFYRFNGSAYEEYQSKKVERDFRNWAVNKQYPDGKGAPKPLVADLGLCANVLAALRSQTELDQRFQPFWISNTADENRSLLAVANGTLMLDEPIRIYPSNRDLFSLASLPVVYTPSALCPRWDKFMVEALGDDPAKIVLLQEWFGYCLTPDTSESKMMYLHGEPGTGKGVTINILAALTGTGYTATSLASLAEPFGLELLVGKKVAVMADARRGKRGLGESLERILNITGQDIVVIPRKYKESLSMKLSCKLVFATNQMIDFQDDAGALMRRLLIIGYRNVATSPDTALGEKLKCELPGILNWAIAGLHRLRTQGYFTVPSSSLLSAEEFRAASNSAVDFVKEYCIIAIGQRTNLDELQRIAKRIYGYQEWTKSKNAVALAVVAASNKVAKMYSRKESDGSTTKFINRLGLKASTIRQYAGGR